MCRKFNFVLTLAVLSLPLAGQANVLPENARTHASVTVVTHRVHQPTPEEVGRAAGLKIRHELELEHKRNEMRWRERTLAERRERSRREYRVAESRRDENPSSRTELAARREDRPAERTETAERHEPSHSVRSETAERQQWEHAEYQEAVARRDRKAADQTETAEQQPSQENVLENTASMPQMAPRLLRAKLLAAAPMRGSLASLERQNDKLAAEGLVRIEDETDLSSRIAHKLLVPVPVSDDLTINQDLPAHHRYCRPWTARFLTDLARAHAAMFHKPLEVSSAVRTVVYQQHLREINGNAAPAIGDIVSPHLTGAVVDIAKGGMSQREIVWMRRWLLPLEAEGKIDVEEEFEQACFHIAVYKTYVPSRPVGRMRSRRRAAALSGPNPYQNPEPVETSAEQPQENPAAE